MLVGKTPFYGQNKDEILEKIKVGKYELPIGISF